MSKNTMTKQDIIASAAAVARDAAEGKLDPADLEATLVAEVKTLVGDVRGPGDPLWSLQCDIARAVLAQGEGIGVDELSEWLHVARRRAGTDTTPEPGSSASGAAGAPEYGGPDDAG